MTKVNTKAKMNINVKVQSKAQTKVKTKLIEGVAMSHKSHTSITFHSSNYLELGNRLCLRMDLSSWLSEHLDII